MPAAYVHDAIALAAQARTGIPGLHEGALCAGAQGPDPLFYYRFFSRVKNTRMAALGSRIHDERTGDFLVALLRHARAHGGSGEMRQLVLSYAWGFLSHFATDSTVHPYVYARSFDREGAYNTNIHCALEAAMDTWLYRRHGHRGIPRQMTGIAALATRERQAIAAVLCGAIAEVFPQDAPTEAQSLRSFADSVGLTRMLHSGHGVKYAVLTTLVGWLGHGGLVEAHAVPTRLPAWDFANEAGLHWSSPWQPGVPRDERLSDLLEAATRRTESLWRLSLAGEEGALRAAIGDAHYGSGLPWQQTHHLWDGQRRGEGNTDAMP